MFSTWSMNYSEEICFKYFVENEVATSALTWDIPTVKAKGLRRHKVHSKKAGRCLYNAVKPRLPQTTVSRKTTKLVRNGFFIRTHIMKAKVI